MLRVRRILLVAVVLVAAVSCNSGGRVIPQHKFAKIYAKMLVADQWVVNEPGKMRIADTSLFYTPIFEEFGYTDKDYVKSVIHYMNDPESFGKVFKETKSILEARIKELTAEERAKARADSIRLAIERSDFRRAPIFRDMDKDSIRIDTVSISLDSSGVLVWERILQDTIYSGPSYVLKSYLDSLAVVADSLNNKAVDSVKVENSAKKTQPKKNGRKLDADVVKIDKTVFPSIPRKFK